MAASQAVKQGSKVGIYWETYNTNPGGEGIQVAITVAPEDEQQGGWLQRSLTALRLVREAQPVSVGMSDVSARGLGFTPRAVVVDLATLKPGRYQLVFHVGDYFVAQGLPVSDPPFIDQVPLAFGIADAQAHYHVPLLVSPWSYSTYRGS